MTLFSFISNSHFFAQAWLLGEGSGPMSEGFGRLSAHTRIYLSASLSDRLSAMRFIRVAPKRPDYKFQPTADGPDVYLSNDFNIRLRAKLIPAQWWLSSLSLDRALLAWANDSTACCSHLLLSRLIRNRLRDSRRRLTDIRKKRVLSVTCDQ